jgi:hypothetical protein
MSEQNLKNHTRFVPLYHFFALPVLVINFIWSFFRLWHLGVSFQGIFGIFLAAALFLAALYGRLFALAVQDRLIRLEEKLRYERVLQEELRWRADELTPNQFIALRFASDEELPALMRKVLDEKITQRKAIKQLIKTWRPDYLRA